MVNKIIHGETLETIKSFPDEFLDCAITSPPYYQLRDYGWAGQWGLEKTYQEYLDHLISLMAELKRILKPMGTMWINLGDTYGGNKKGNTDNKQNHDDNLLNKNDGINKSLILIPHRFAIRCIDELGLILRNDVIWAKRNGMPESVTDRFSKKHEYFFFFAKQQKYYFDLDGVKDKSISRDFLVRDRDTTKLNNTPGRTKMAGLKTNNYDLRNPGSVSDFWDIPTQPNSEKHYATFNSDLIDKPIIAGCPINGIILDPFCGIGTTLLRARQLDRNYIGIEGKKEYCEIAERRIKDFESQLKLFTPEHFQLTPIEE